MKKVLTKRAKGMGAEVGAQKWECLHSIGETRKSFQPLWKIVLVFLRKFRSGWQDCLTAAERAH